MRRPVGYIAIGAAALACVTILFAGNHLRETTVENEQTISDTAKHLAIELGLGPTTLVLADVSVQKAQEALIRIDDATALQTSISSARASLGQYSETYTEAQELLWIDPRNEEAARTLADAQRGMESAQTALTTALQSLFTAATDELFTQQEISVITAISARYRLGADPEWIAFECDAVQRTAIAEAMHRTQRAERLGEAIDPEDQTLLTTVRTNQAVVQAKARLDSQLEAMEALFATSE